MQRTMNATGLNPAPLFLAALVLTSCKGKFTSSSSSSNDWNINGHRTSTRTHNGITRKLETDYDIEIRNGRVTTFPKGALVKIHESGGSELRQAELRENGNKMELQIKEDGKFRIGTAEEELWLECFLNEFTTK